MHAELAQTSPRRDSTNFKFAHQVGAHGSARLAVAAVKARQECRGLPTASRVIEQPFACHRRQHERAVDHLVVEDRRI